MFSSEHLLAQEVYRFLDEVLEPSIGLIVECDTPSYETFILVKANKYVRGKGLLSFSKLYSKEKQIYRINRLKLDSDFIQSILIDITNHLGV